MNASIIPEQPEAADATLFGGERPKARILIVDDDRHTALALNAALEKLDQVLVVAHSGEEALQRLLPGELQALTERNTQNNSGYLRPMRMRAVTVVKSASLVQSRYPYKYTAAIGTHASPCRRAMTLRSRPLTDPPHQRCGRGRTRVPGANRV